MKKVTKYIFFSLLILMFINGCSSDNNEKNTTNENIFQYEGTLIGDNSAVINIIGQLQHSEEFNEVSLQTESEPYGMTLTYNEIDATMIEEEYEETVIYNATFLFALIDNAEWITFVFENDEYKITKEELQKWYGKELSEFNNEEELISLVQEQLEDGNKVNRLLN
ncbi:DUF4825 domain-containing protein [Jeotgalibaca sp. PTS2502]|uniref:DUF4825 domain-containing protein n=1 Tax=Jeotgalibaca sp. PTS2502 TaxID=1903686 RepID=UPI0009739410|nr:DUF4825 domain-containing protein [Jeotgalibaca sp. PTS2502]APZ48811.1 DUF4825 domain-containing protein [Jeotgalibaca sp. PTS2502]